MTEYVIKRDGRTVEFDSYRILSAISRAFTGVEKAEHHHRHVASLSQKVVEKIRKDYYGKDKITVEAIQDYVEQVLMEAGEHAAAKRFILYRNQRSNARNQKLSLTQTYADLLNKSTADMDLKRENANIDTNAPMGIMLRFGSEGSKDYVMRYVLRPEHAKAHRDGDIHIHDMDFYMLTLNCCQIDLEPLFKRGFSTGHGFIREPNSITSAAALCCIVIQSNQNDQHGGQSIPMFEYNLAPYVVKSFKKHLKNIMDCENIAADQCSFHYSKEMKEAVLNIIDNIYIVTGEVLNQEEKYMSQVQTNQYLTDQPSLFNSIFKQAKYLTEQETYQAMEALIHNLNSMQSRAGAQVPFSSVNYGTGTREEERLIIKAILEATDKGLGDGETPIFPVQIFKVKDGINTSKGDPNYDLFHRACEVSAKRLFPNFSFLDQPYNMQYYKPGDPKTEVAVMGCRTRVFGNHFDPSNEIIPGRGNISFTTINLPRLAIMNPELDQFYAALDNMFELVCQQILDRFEIIANKHVYNYPFLMGQGVWLGSDKLDPSDTIREVMKHGSLSVGFIGLAECLVALTGKHHGESDSSQALGLAIIRHMRDLADKKAQETGLNFSLFSTPAEGLSGRFVKIDKARFGVIPGVTDRDYYTNSFHVPVYYKIPAFKKLSIEGPYHELCNAGAISYVEVDGNISRNIDAFERLVLAMKDCGIGYGSINHPVDRCPVCGYVGVIDDVCPKCGRHDGEGVSVEKLRSIGVCCIKED